MLDVDNQTEGTTVTFAKDYANFHGLGKVLIMKTSERGQLDLLNNIVNGYAIIFGKRPLHWEEIKWHITEARRLGMVERKFVEMRENSYVTIRTNPKNSKTPRPTIIGYYGNGENKGVMEYLKYWTECKSLGHMKAIKKTITSHLGLRKYDITTDFPRHETRWTTIEQRANYSRMHPTDIYKQDIKREIEQGVK